MLCNIWNLLIQLWSLSHPLLDLDFLFKEIRQANRWHERSKLSYFEALLPNNNEISFYQRSLCCRSLKNLPSEYKTMSCMGKFKRNLKIVKCETCVSQLCQTYHVNITFLNISEYIYVNINVYIYIKMIKCFVQVPIN